MATISERDIFAPSFWEAWNDFLLQKYTDMWFTGGRGCVSADTLIATPKGDIPIAEFKGGTVYAYDGENIIEAKALPAEKFTEEDLYAVTLDDGTTLEVTDQHRFLTQSDGWKMTKDLKAGDNIAVAKARPSHDPNVLPSISIPKKFQFPTVDKTLFERADDSISALDSLANWTDNFTVPLDSSSVKVKKVASVAFSRRAPYYDIFVPVYNNYLSANGIINHNSTKSSFVSMCIVLGMIRDAQEAFRHKKMGDKRWMSYLTHAIVYRKIAADLRISVYNQFIWSIEKLGLTNKFKFSISPLRITFLATKQMIDFRGLDDPIKSKSIKAPFGYYKYSFFEELNQFDGIEEIRNVKQSVQRGGRAFQSFCCFNPPESVQNWANFESYKIVPGRKVYHSDYRSVPREWLGEQFFKEAEILRLDNERAYRHEYLGEATGNGGNVFQNVSDRRITDEEISQWRDDFRWGCDFGLQDPTVLVGLYYSKLERSIFIAREVYRSGMLLSQIEEEFKKAHFGWGWIMADSASPQMIMELENRGLPILPVTKFRDSIKHGISWLRDLRHIYIDQLRCPNAFREFSQYEFEKLKGTNQYTERPASGMDHAIDSVRYSVMDLCQNAGF